MRTTYLAAAMLLVSATVGGGAIIALQKGSPEKRLSYVESNHAEFAVLIGDKYKCARACVGSGTPYCQAVPLNTSYRRSIRLLAGQLNSTSHLANATLISDFELDNDPCERGDSTLRDGRWINSGQECLLNANVDVFGDGKPVKFELGVPGDIAFRADTAPLGKRYVSEGGAILLRIYDEGLNDEWGGAVSEVFDTGQNVLVQLPRGCIKLEG